MNRLVLAALMAASLLLAQEPTPRPRVQDVQDVAGRPRSRDIGLIFGALPPGPRDAITDVAGVRVGHATLIQGETVRTGVTVVLPHAGNLFRDKVAGAVYVGNAFGKLAG